MKIRMRITGVLLIFLTCAMIGMALSLNMKRKLERLGLLRRMADEIAMLIRYRSLTVREIIAQLKYSSAYDDLIFLKSNDYSDRSVAVCEIWERNIVSDYTLTEEEKKALLSLGTQLGTTDTQGQLSVIAGFAAEIEEMQERQIQKYNVKGKLYRSMGILIGAMAGIMII